MKCHQHVGDEAANLPSKSQSEGLILKTALKHDEYRAAADSCSRVSTATAEHLPGPAGRLPALRGGGGQGTHSNFVKFELKNLQICKIRIQKARNL